MRQPWKIRLHLADREEKTLFLKLANQVIQEILSGRLTQGARLPGSRTLADELGINRKTVQSVYEDLEAQGWLVSKARQGTFVSEYLPDLNAQPAASVQMQQAAPAAPAQAQMKNDGVPDNRLIPYELFSRAYRHALIQVTRHQIMGYGDPQGSSELRQALLHMLSMERFIQASAENICVVRGSQMGIFLAARVLARHQPQRNIIVVEQWAYPPAVETFLSNHYQVIRVRLDRHGLDTEHLTEILSAHAVAAVYTTPHHQYPTTVTMPMERRLKLLELSKAFDFHIIEDDYDHEFHYDSRPVPPLISLPAADKVIHIGSLSKVFAPSLRIGYVVAGPRGMLHRANYTVNVRRDATADYPAAVWALRSDEVDSILPDWSNLPRNHRVAGTGKDKPASINVGKSHVHVVRGVGYTAALRSALVLPKPAHAFKVARALLSDTYFVVVEIADILDDPTD